LYFVLVVKVIIPALSAGEAYFYQQQYAALGNTPAEMLHTVFTRPWYVLGLLFKNHLGVADGNYVKAELHAMVLLSGGLALLRRPGYLLMLAPIYGQKLLSANIMHWGLNYQYSIEFVPVLHAAVSAWLASSQPRRATRLAAGAAALTLIATLVSMQVRRSPYYDKAAAKFFSSRHYRVGFDAAAVHRGLASIPAAARVSATTAVVPHLAARPFIYQYPYVADADYIVALYQTPAYPLSEAELKAQLAEYVASGRWEVALQEGPLYILRRIRPLPMPEKRFFARRSLSAEDPDRGPGAGQ
jgi:uncharacterized membrane protein